MARRPPRGRDLVAREQQPAQPRGDEREHDVVDRAAERLADRPDPLDLDVGDRQPAMLAERHVEARVRRRGQLVAQGEVDEAAGSVEPDARGQRGEAGEVVQDAVPRRRRRVGSAPGRRRGAGVEHHRRGVAGADAVDQAVVGLGGERPSPVLEPLEQHAAPQRPRAVEAVRVEVAGPVEQLALAAGRRQRGPRDVGRDVEVGVVLPPGPPEAARRPARQPLPVARQRGEPLLEPGAQLVEAGRGPVEDEDAADVHVRAAVRVLELEERGVERRQQLSHGAQTRRGTFPVRVRIVRIALWPRSAVWPNMHGQPPSITAMPCSRP